MSYKDRYKKGTVRVIREYHDFDEDPFIPAAYYDEEELEYFLKNEVVATLNHQCDGWVIGGIEQIDALIEDLIAARKKLVDNQAAV